VKAFSVPVTARLTRKDSATLEKGCEATGENVGAFVRRAILREMARLGWLDPERRRLLLPGSLDLESK
jgi:hypothetical protein